MGNVHVVVHQLETLAHPLLASYFQHLCQLKRIQWLDSPTNDSVPFQDQSPFLNDDSSVELRSQLAAAQSEWCQSAHHLVMIRDPRDILVSEQSPLQNGQPLDSCVMDSPAIESIIKRFEPLMEHLSLQGPQRYSVGILRYEDLQWNFKRWVRQTLQPFGDRNWYFATRLHRRFETVAHTLVANGRTVDQPTAHRSHLKLETIQHLNIQFDSILRSFYPGIMGWRKAA